MKNQYFGDVNDYLKYGLLRCFADAGLTLGVCWMLTPEDGRSDGRKISYLNNWENWRACDPNLFDSLAIAVRTNARHVRYARRFLENTVFFEQSVPDNAQSRKKWLTNALARLGTVELLFFDPDNGVEVKSKPVGSRDSNKYLYWNEVEEAWMREKSLLIFQHFPRANRDQFTSRLVAECGERLRTDAVVPLITSNVLFLVACQPKHASQIHVALDAVEAKWSGRIKPLSNGSEMR